MSTSNTRAKHLRSTVGTIVMALAFASVIGGLSVVPAFGQDTNRRQWQQEQGRYERERHDGRGWYERERHDRRGWYERDRRAYQPYRYSAPIYVPPPVVYGPYPPPSIHLFFPFHFR